jgi:hypothetical protein
MIQPDKPSMEQKFDAAFRLYADRKPRCSPRQASARIADQIRQAESPLGAGWMLTAVAGFLLAAVGATLFWRTPQAIQPGSGIQMAGNQPLSQGVVLLWIDENTPLYMTFQPPEELQENSIAGKGDKQ